MKINGIANAINLLLSHGESTEGKALVFENYIVLGAQRLYFQDEWVVEDENDGDPWVDRFERLEDAVDKFICHSL